jgi:ubiquinol-cytochrome c reductase subunit 7
MSLLAGRTSRLASLAVKNAQVKTIVPNRTALTKPMRISLPYTIRKWMYDLSGFNQYGLYHNDIYIETEEVGEALRRLPKDLQDQRTFRMYRATQLYIQKTRLPKDQWPTYDEDLEHGRYLDQLIEEIQKENAEKSMWAKR